MRESGKTASAFSESQYAVSEDKSPNVHTRQVRPAQVAGLQSAFTIPWHLTNCCDFLQEEGVRESAD